MRIYAAQMVLDTLGARLTVKSYCFLKLYRRSTGQIHFDQLDLLSFVVVVVNSICYFTKSVLVHPMLRSGHLDCYYLH